jgi:hypothetical protein
MVAAGLAVDSKDPGMKGVTRYARLPVGVNAKAKYVEQLGHAFRVRCAIFDPLKRYSITEIAEAWHLDMTPEPPKRARVVAITQAQALSAGDQFAALLRTLELMGMYRGRNSANWHEIGCPWSHLHTSHTDTGTAISDPSGENNFAGGFKCHHGHCENRSMRDVWAWARTLSRELRRA